MCAAVARLRGEDLYKLPGVGETIAWAQALLALDDAELEETLGVALKVREDIERVREREVLERCLRRRPAHDRLGLGLLAASMRAGGARLGIGELLAAHRALRRGGPRRPAARPATRCGPRCARGARTWRCSTSPSPS